MFVNKWIDPELLKMRWVQLYLVSNNFFARDVLQKYINDCKLPFISVYDVTL